MAKPLMTVFAASALVYGLARTRPVPTSLIHNLSAPHEWVETVGTDRAMIQLAGAGLWVATTWLLLSLTASVWVERTGRRRGLLAAIARSAPPQLRRAVLTSLGVSMLFGSVDAHAAGAAGLTYAAGARISPAPGWPLDGSPSARQPAAPNPVWPMLAPGPAMSVGGHSSTRTSADASSSPPGRAAPSPTATPTTPTPQPSGQESTRRPSTRTPVASDSVTDGAGSPAWPTTPATPTTPTRPTRPTAPRPTTAPTAPPSTTEPASPGSPTAPPSGAQPPAAAPPAPPSSPESVTVQPGDSLWTITAQALGPGAAASDIAVDWPHWYRLNRRVIGSDPGLLQPGQRLVVPSHQKGRS